MPSVTTQAIVLRHADYREHDRMLTLLTPGGRMDVLARGCKRPKSPLLPCSELFAMGSYELAGAHGHAVVASCLLQESFYNLRLDMDRLSCAAYMANICEATVQPDDNAQRPFLLLAHALKRLNFHDDPPRAVLSVFLLHYAIAMGYRPRLNHCVSCGQEMEQQGGALFDIEQGGVLCPDCAGQLTRGMVLQASELSWLREAREKGIRCELPPEDAPLSLLQAYLEARIEKHIPPLMTKL